MRASSTIAAAAKGSSHGASPEPASLETDDNRRHQADADAGYFKPQAIRSALRDGPRLGVDGCR
jgi:hypothetical protein